MRLHAEQWLIAGAIASVSTAIHAQPDFPNQAGTAGPSSAEGRRDDITVIGRRSSPLDTIAPEQQYTAGDISALGANSIAEVVQSLSARRGNSSSDTVVLLNGKRISGFGEINTLPPEAVKSVDILPERVALAYGYGPGQRVINVTLLDRFRAATLDLWASTPTEGGQTSSRLGTNRLRIEGSTRWSFDASYRSDTLLREFDRNIRAEQYDSLYSPLGNIVGVTGGEIDPGLSVLAGRPVLVAGVPAMAGTSHPSLADFAASAERANLLEQNRYRSLLPRSAKLNFNASLSGFVANDISGTINLQADITSTDELLGTPTATLLLPDTSPFSPFQKPVALLRTLDPPRPIMRKVRTTNLHAGGVLNGAMGAWQWTLTTNLDHSTVQSRTTGLFSVAALQERLDARDPVANPFAPLTAAALLEPANAQWQSTAASAELVAYGTILSLAAGPVSGSATAAAQYTALTASSSGPRPRHALARDRQSFQFALDVPLASSDRGTGNLSANGSLAVSRLGDVGTIRQISYGLRWNYRPALTVTTAVLDEEAAPSMLQLGEAAVATPNTRIFDFRTGRTTGVTRLQGGMPELRRSKRRRLSVEVLVRPLSKADVTFQVDYLRQREDNPIFAFPAWTTELEASFPQRFQRDASGGLISIDARPVNFFNARQESVRGGIRWSREYSRPTGASVRADASLFVTWTLKDRVDTAKGGQRLDFLHGSSNSLLGGTPRWRVTGEGGIYYKGLGLRVDATFRSASSIERAAAAGKALKFDGFAAANAKLFWDLSKATSERWLNGVRLTLGVTNVLVSRPRVRREDGLVPVAYQPALLDPIGRSVSLGLRKLF